jgi:hypothetical protein
MQDKQREDEFTQVKQGDMQDVQIPLRLNIPEAQFTEHLLT